MVLSRKVLAFMLLALPPTAVSALTYFVGGASGVTALGVGALSSFAFCDFWYFLRMGLNTVTPSPRGPRRHLFAVSKSKGRIGLMDIDRNGHCNNARFLRECGFGRRDLWQVRA
ncbi:RxLR effector candidate protein [Phytophthora palmivora]|uniref:RxLR effector candidate protein n=1 Tax=Phytophthora palmivora TaxID=4796 RepID=A0A2P4Y6N9_9STRA|nr:RxLR effector candidate protein [Phytophthora palmivora]